MWEKVDKRGIYRLWRKRDYGVRYAYFYTCRIDDETPTQFSGTCCTRTFANSLITKKLKNQKLPPIAKVFFQE